MALYWRGFFGGGVILVKGRDDYSTAKGLNQDQKVTLDFASLGLSHGLWFEGNGLYVAIHNLLIKIKDDSNPDNARVALTARRTTHIQVYGSFIKGTGNQWTTCLSFSGGTTGHVTWNYLSTCRNALYVTQGGIVFARENSSSGTDNYRGYHTDESGVIFTHGETPTGTECSICPSTTGHIWQ